MEANQLNQKFAKNVILVDVAVLTREATQMRRAMSWGLKRELQKIDMFTWLHCVALDGGTPKFGDDVQVIFVTDRPDTYLEVAQQPDFLKNDGQAFTLVPTGEFLLNTVHPAGLTDTASLYVDLMHLLLDNADVENLLLLSSEELHGQLVREELDKLAEDKGVEAVKKACLFCLYRQHNRPYREEVLTLSLAHVFGIQPSEIK